ncbi:hypothetical protein PUN28_013129 [Cardiocondyla obscurior]|uniref:Uncharacterized protein n=1 Tax=Cardiocondyla obscurior TaxID=286306 RepID=A0AAW2FC50_9HYME
MLTLDFSFCFRWRIQRRTTPGHPGHSGHSERRRRLRMSNMRRWSNLGVSFIYS